MSRSDDPTPTTARSRDARIEAVRARLRERTGPAYWRSLEELAEDEAFLELLHDEFPQQAGPLGNAVDRRRFLQLGAASLALGGMAACTRQPLEKIVPYVEQPEQVVPGRPLFFASAMSIDGLAVPLIVESHEGRPTKVEGNPDHPLGTGASDVIAQASVLGLYDPDRSQVVKRNGRISGLAALESNLRGRVEALDALEGLRLRILTPTLSSPTLERLVDEILHSHPLARWHTWDPVTRDETDLGSRIAYGEAVATRYDLAHCDVVLALESNFLVEGPRHLRDARDFAERRRLEGSELNRLYAVESTPTATGTVADHRLALRPSQIAPFAQAVAAALNLGPAPDGLDTGAADLAAAVAADLALHPRRSAVVPGPYADAAVHALAHAINAALGNTGATVHHHRPVTGGGSQAEGLTELTEAMRGGEVDLLLILGGNPVYDAPADLDFAAAMGEVPDRIHLGLYEDETAALCHWHVPAAHYLESWADDRAADGTVTLTQPLIEPLYDGHTAAELLSFLLPDRGPRGSYELIRDTWRERLGEEGFEAAWRRALHDGFLAGTAAEPVAPAVRAGAVADAVAAMRRPPGGGLELALRPDPTVWDGAFANNGWLQECPKPLTKLTWDNAALMAPATARALGLESEQVVRLEVDSRSVTAPVQVLPGHAPGAVSLHLGGGRERVGRVGRGVGVDAYALRTTAGLWWAAGLAVTPTRARHRLATTQLHHNIALEGPESEERHLIRSADLAHFREHPDFAQHMGHVPPPELSLFPPRDYEGHRWALTVDLNMCTGCNACVIACQAENNIPVVGKEEVLKGREMHWIRVDRYYAGDLDAPDVHHQPVMCQHCEQAPCEVVCPVAATVHSDEGLNDMVYNRCIGTRYCSNNCPYKVRRFNFFLYQDFETPVLELLRNPDVSVRSRGVMEKCTYCVQRINGARFAAEREGRKLRDGDIQTACQQACPARAITFGDMNDPDSALAARKSSPRNYGILEETNTRPRTTYLAKVSNPNPRLAADGADGGGHGDGEVG